MKDVWNWRAKIFKELACKMRLSGEKTVIDLGCADAQFKNIIKPLRYVGVGIDDDPTCDDLDANRLDVVFDIDTCSKWPWHDNEFDLCIASQVLEHVLLAKNACNEIKRIAANKILIGLPNDMRLESRLFMLFGRNPIGAMPRAHCRMFDVNNGMQWVEAMFGDEFYIEKSMYFYASRGNTIIPQFMQNFAVKLSCSLFAGEQYYLLQRRVLYGHS
jgi:hypothetical protein